MSHFRIIKLWRGAVRSKMEEVVDVVTGVVLKAEVDCINGGYSEERKAPQCGAF